MNNISNIITQGYKEYFYTSFIDLRKYLIVSICLFIAGLLIGHFDLLGINNVLIKVITNIFEKFVHSRGFDLFLKIILQNSKATLVIILSGIVFSIFPIFASTFNGMIIGCLLANIELFSNSSKFEGIMQMIPHGIFEIPAIILAISVGIKLGIWPYQKNKLSFLKTYFLRALQCYIIVILPLLLIAGTIETLFIELRLF